MMREEAKRHIESFNIPKYFYICLFGELVKVFGINLIEPDTGYLDEYDDDGNVLPSQNDDYSYRDQIGVLLTYFGSTSGYNIAFKEACKQCNLMNLYQFYEKPDWSFSDYFDGCILDNVVSVFFDKDSVNEYYFNKIGE